MAEYRFYDADKVAPVSTYEFHAGRPRAPHLEQEMHRTRLMTVSRIINDANPRSVVDLGCGDGGLLSLLNASIPAWGYDFQPANAEGWQQRGVVAHQLDFVAHSDQITWAELVVVTEVLEHLDNPHGMLELISHQARYIVASSPYGETIEQHADEHAWGWDYNGYQEMFDRHWIVTSHFLQGWCQILTARSKNR
jgi:Methyltransferase domain